jgi:FdhD protein
MRDRADQYRYTGGVHSAGLAAGDELVAHCEDIGRHNAVDKVVGRALLAGVDFHATALLATGRLSSEMVWKAARAGVPVVTSLSIPTDLARDIAEAAGITLVGRILSARPWVYTYRERLRDLQE